MRITERIAMETREEIIQLWFAMWLQKADLGIADIFSEDAVYVESWGPAYHGTAKIKLWFDEWNTRGDVLEWPIKQYFHKGDQTLVEWYFKSSMYDGTSAAFDGISLLKWTPDGKICFLKEFGCHIAHYDPYKNGGAPQFRDEAPLWF